MSTPSLHPAPARRGSWILAGAIAALLCSTSVAQTQLSTLANPHDYGAVTSSSGFWGFAFTTGDESYELLGVTVRLRVDSAGSVAAQLYLATEIGLPTGSALTGIETRALATDSTYNTYLFTAPEDIVLTANQSYAIAFNFSSGTYTIPLSNPANGYTTASGNNWEMSQYLWRNSGSGWDSYGGSAGMLMLGAVEAAAIPEPGAYAALAGVLALGAAIAAKRRTRRAAD